MTQVVVNEPFGNGTRTPEVVNRKAAESMKEFVNERVLELFDIRSFIPDFLLPQKPHT